MPTFNTTPNRGYEEPAIGNTLAVDVGQLIAALRKIDIDMANALAAIVAKANLASPAFSGVPTAPTAAPGTSTSQIASCDFVATALAALVDSSPGALDTLNELAAALGDDPNFSTTVLDAIGLKANSADVTAALALKADDAAVTAALADKADAATTTAALALKADATALGKQVIQEVFLFSGSVATGATQIPDDDTIPQIGEGNEYTPTTLTFTPTNAANILEISGQLVMGNSDSRALTMALFQTGVANALKAVRLTSNGAAYSNTEQIFHRMVAGSTSALEFQLRYGPAGASTMTVNGVVGGRKYGGVMDSYLIVREVTP